MSTSSDKIQWYPGHMAKSIRMMRENLTLVDVLIELLDARIPFSSKNPDIDELARNKHRIAVLNKADLADAKANAAWKRHYEGQEYQVALTDSSAGKGLQEVAALAGQLMADKIARQKARGRLIVPIRAMIVGIPNVGKSTMINRYAKKAVTKVADRPGVTRGKQWIKISNEFELLDTPGILWPKFEDAAVGRNLAIVGSINDNILDIQDLAETLIDALRQIRAESLIGRYGIEIADEDDNYNVLSKIGEARGFKTKEGGIDLRRSAIILLDEFRGGKLGRITLEMP